MAYPDINERGAAADGAVSADGEPVPEKIPPHQRLLRSRGFIPTVVVLVLVVFVLLSPRMAGSPPRMESITPTRGKPGDVMIISGRNFGATRETSEVRISGISPTSQDYTEWTDTRISVRIPDEAASGIVYVITKSGRSGGLLFINQADIPQPALGASRPGDPYIVNKDNPIQPSAARVGDLITIYGMNFGLEKGSSEVYFTWSGPQSASSGSLDLSNLLPARDYNLDYVSWSDREIQLRVPDGAASGNLLVKSDKGTSNAAYFVVNRGAGSKSYSSPRKYSVQYGLSVSVTAATAENTLYLWMPRILPTAEQRSIESVGQDPASLLDTSEASLYSFTNLQKGGKYHVSLSWMFDRYAVSTQVNPSDVPAYVTTTDLYTQFTAPDRLVPSGSPEVLKAVAAAIGGEKNPWLKARRAYDWELSLLTYSASADDTVAALRSKKADSFVFSSLYCALLRAAGVPARMVAGYLVGDSGQPTRRHFWDEFYVETLGWVPVDPTLGDEKSLLPSSFPSDGDPRAYYFGNLDNQHVTFTKGLVPVNQMNPAGTVREDRTLPYLLSLYAESEGGLASYSTSFEDLSVTGTY
ncbi:MAG TPA: transglutaminase domain-containing protein [Spirochaetia bacterium]|nr:transglutaminase domain-containing protein [Spirochaetia bacterium]